MNSEKLILIDKIQQLSNILDKQYDKEFSFRNHCYLRIAFDITINDKWNNKVTKPFVKYATEIELKNVLILLNTYLTDKNILIADNKKSLFFREKNKKTQLLQNPELF